MADCMAKAGTDDAKKADCQKKADDRRPRRPTPKTDAAKKDDAPKKCRAAAASETA